MDGVATAAGPFELLVRVVCGNGKQDGKVASGLLAIPRSQVELMAEQKERVRPLMTTLNAACSEWLYRGHFDAET